MDRGRAGVVFVAFVCVLAVATAAATVSSTEQTATTTGGESLAADDDADSQGDSSESSSEPIGNAGGLSMDVGGCVPWLYSAWFFTLVAIVAMTIWLVAEYRGNIVTATAIVVGLALPFTFVWLLLSNCGSSRSEDQTAALLNGVVETARGGDATFGILGDVGAFDAPAWLALALAAIGIVAIALTATRGDTTDSDDDPGDGDLVEPELDDAAAIGAVAGRAADRIERSADVDNEIYRAWVDMTRHVDVDHPDSSTPGEFAATAVDAGVDPDTVAELTALFERVRYGDEQATDARERRAVEALRAIEADATAVEAFWGVDDRLD